MNKKTYWGNLMEKSWAKVKGNYDIADGGFFETGIRALTGMPVVSTLTSTITTSAQANAMW
jgi:hypothetical protein